MKKITKIEIGEIIFNKLNNIIFICKQKNRYIYSFTYYIHIATN